MLKKWICFQVILGSEVETFVGKLEYPFSKYIESSKNKSVICFDCVMKKNNDQYVIYPQNVNGVNGQVFFKKDNILTYSPLKETSAYWEERWQKVFAREKNN